MSNSTTHPQTGQSILNVDLKPQPQSHRAVLERLQQGTIKSEELISFLRIYRLMPQLMRELIIDQAIDTIPCTDDETTTALDQIYKRYGIRSNEERNIWLECNDLTLQQLGHSVTRSLRIEKFKKINWERRLESYFLQRKSQMDLVIYSLIRVDDPALVQELYFRIQSGEQSFADLARMYSQGAESQTGGLVGPTQLSTPHPALAQRLALNQPGKLLLPIELEGCFVLIRLEKFISAQLDSSTRQRLLDELLESWVREKMLTVGN